MGKGIGKMRKRKYGKERNCRRDGEGMNLGRKEGENEQEGEE